MAWNTSGPAQLGADNVIRFLDVDHFLRELQGNLGRGRVFVRSKRRFELRTTLPLRIEAPGVAWGIPAQATVVFVRDGFIGLELEDFEAKVLPRLDLLGEEAARAVEAAAGPSERTVIAPSPMTFAPGDAGSGVWRGPETSSGATVDPSAFEEDERTGEMRVSPALRDLRGGSSTSNPEATRPDPAEYPDGATDLTAELRPDEGSSAGEGSGADDDFELLDDVFDELEAEILEGDETSDAPAPPPLRGRRQPSGIRVDAIEPRGRRGDRAEAPRPTVADLELRDLPKLEVKPLRPAVAQAIEAAPSAPLPPLPDRTEDMPRQPEAALADLARQGIEALRDKRLHLPRATPSGVLRAADAGSLLGLYLAELRHGHLTMLGGPEGNPGDAVKIRIAAGSVITLEAVILARVGEWLTVSIADPSPMRRALADLEEAWREALAGLGGGRDGGRARVDEPLAPPPDDGATARGARADDGAPPPAASSADPSAGRTRDERPGREADDRAATIAPPVIAPEPTIPARAEPRRSGLPAPSSSVPSVPQLLDIDDLIDVVLPPPPTSGRGDRGDRGDRGERPERALAEPAASITPGAERSDRPPERPAPAPERSGPEWPPAERAAAIRPTAPPPAPALPALPPLPPPDDGPPRVPKLTGDVVCFDRTKDVRHELDTNLKNGGLFVDAAPLPLRTHKSLRVSIGGAMTAVRIEADVVFAAGGRVGFSVGGAQEVKSALERAMEGLSAQPAPQPAPSLPPPAGSPMSSLGAASSIDLVHQVLGQAAAQAAVHGESPGVTPFSGRIKGPLTSSELLDLQTRQPKSSADLVAAPVLLVFEHLHRNAARGVLTLRSGARSAAVYFHEGNVAYVESSPFEEESSLGRMLIGSKKLSESALRDALERAKQQRRPLGRVLVSLGAINKQALSDAIREQTRTKLEATFSWKEGTYEWAAWREPPGDADLVLTKSIGIVARYARARYDSMSVSDLEQMFGRNMGRALLLEKDADTIGASSGLKEKDLRFFEVSMAGERTIADAVVGSPLSRLSSLRLIALAVVVGMVRFRDGRLGTNAGAAPRSRSDAENPQAAALKRDLKERLSLMKGLNFFEVLGVHWSAHYRSYRAPYEKLRRELDPSRGALRDAPADVQELARKLLELADKAYATLSDEKQRVSYRNQFFDKTERQYSADMLVKQGEVALMRGDRVGAIEALETAVELDPSSRNRSLLGNAREGRT